MPTALFPRHVLPRNVNTSCRTDLAVFFSFLLQKTTITDSFSSALLKKKQSAPKKMYTTGTNKQANKQEKEELQVFLTGQIPKNHQLQLQGIKYTLYYTIKNAHLQQCKFCHITSIKLKCLCQILIIHLVTSAHRCAGENSLYQSSVKQVHRVQGVKGSPSYQAWLLVYHQVISYSSYDFY